MRFSVVTAAATRLVRPARAIVAILAAGAILAGCSGAQNESSTAAQSDDTARVASSASTVSTTSADAASSAASSEATSSSEAAENGQAIAVPQDLYGVAAGSDPFTIQAKADSKLTFESSDESIARVDEDGVVTVGDKTGIATITITAAGSGDSKPVTAQTQVRVSNYKNANGYMAHSASDKDGKMGDSTGNESVICKYQKWNWGFFIRCTDPAIASRAAVAVRYIVENPYFGYDECRPVDQATVDRRASIYEVIHEALGDSPKLDDLKKIADLTTYADTSCSPTLLAGYWLYIDMDTQLSLTWKPPYDTQPFTYYCGSVNIENNQLETAIAQVNKEYEEAGKLAPFQIVYIPEDEQDAFFDKHNVKQVLKQGDIICRLPDPAKGGHTAMML